MENRAEMVQRYFSTGKGYEKIDTSGLRKLRRRPPPTEPDDIPAPEGDASVDNTGGSGAKTASSAGSGPNAKRSLTNTRSKQ